MSCEERIVGRSGRSWRVRRLPSSRAAMMLMLLAGPSPLKRAKSRTCHLPRRCRLLPASASTRCIRATALSSVLPEPIRMASSSASVRASAPFCIIFSRGRSSSAHWLMLSLFIGCQDLSKGYGICMALRNDLFPRGLFSPSRERGRRLLRPCFRAAAPLLAGSPGQTAGHLPGKQRFDVRFYL